MASERIHTLGIMAAIIASRPTNFPDSRGPLSSGPTYMSPENAAKTAYQILAAAQKVQDEIDQRMGERGQ